MSLRGQVTPSAMLLTLTLILCLSQYAPAQHSAAVKVHTFRLIDGLYTAGIEKAFHQRVTVDLSLQGGDYIDVKPNRSEAYRVSGIGIMTALRYYPFATKIPAPRGFFGYAAFRYIDFDETYRNSISFERFKVGGNMTNAGLGVGYKFTYNRLGLEGFVGWGTGRLKSDNSAYRNNIPAFHRSSIEEQQHFPQLDVALCYMFSPF